MGVLKKNYTTTFRDFGTVTIPKGTRTTHQTALGIDKKYNFVAEFGWVKPHDNGIPQHGLLMDLKSYGLNVPAEFITE